MNTKPWHEDDKFWELRAQFMFGAQRWERTPREVDLALAMLGVEAGAQMLDLCCGQGRHSLELARRGFRVTGVDRTVSYLDEARRLAAAEGLDIEFVEADMREFRREEAFDAAINMFTAFGYFDDPAEDRRVIENLHASLRPGGKLLIETNGKELLAARFRPCDWSSNGDVLFLSERTIQRDWGWIHNHEIYIVGSERFEFDLDHRLYSAVELKALLTGCGFAEVTCYGSLEGTPYDQNAQRLAVLGSK